MDTRTGDIYPDREDALQKLRAEGVSQAEAESRLVPISKEEYDLYAPLNRAERRKLHREKLRAEKNIVRSKR